MASLQHIPCGKSLAQCPCPWTGADQDLRTRTYITDPLSGKRRPKSRNFTAKGKRAALREHNRIAAELEAEAAESRKHGASVAGLVDDWLTLRRRDCSPSTLIAYERHAKRIKREFGHLPADQLTGQHIDRWYSKLMADGMTAKNVNHVHRVLRAVCRFGHRKRGLPLCATDHATPPPINDAFRARPPTASAVRVLLEGDGQDTPGVSGEWGRAVRLLAHTGLRRGEVVGLRWDSIGEDVMIVRHSVVEPKGGGVVIKEPKGKRERVVSLSPEARAVLDEQQRFVAKVGESRWVFPDWTCDGKTPHRPGWVSLMWGRYMRGMIDAGTMKPEHRVRLHDLRHAYATTLLDAGVPLNDVAEELGHAKASTTSDIYGHRGERGRSMVRDVIQRELGRGT